MTDRFVTVGSYAFDPEAQMAKNLLEAEGIPAFLLGELTANVLTNAAGQVHLQVRDQDAQRAVAVLAATLAQASLDHDWETQAERDVWTCPKCGTAVRLGDDVCPACLTSNPGITTDRRDTWTDPRRSPRETAQVKKSDQIQADVPRSLLPAADEDSEEIGPRAGPGCLVLLFAPLWLLWREGER